MQKTVSCFSIFALLFSLTFSQRVQACVLYDSSSDFPATRDNQIPAFHSISDDKAVVMGFAVKNIPVDGGTSVEPRQVFNFFYCNRFQSFNRSQQEIYPQESCMPLSPMWIPVVHPNDPDQELISQFSANVVQFLKESLSTQLSKQEADPYFILLDGALNRTLVAAFAGSTILLSYRMAPPATRAGRFFQKSFRLAGVLAILGIGLSALAEVGNEREHENIYDQNLKELNSLIALIDRENYYNHKTKNEPLIYIFEEVNKAIKKSMESMLYGQCGYI